MSPIAPGPMRLLIADDDPVSRLSLEFFLRRLGYDVVVAEDGLQALERLTASDAPEMAVLDWMMPGMDGPDVVRSIRALERESYTYLLLLTARGDDADLVAGLDAGADDYVTKPFNLAELEARLRVGGRILDLQRRLREERAIALHLAKHDALTGALGRSAVMECLVRDLALAERQPNDVLVTLLDLDHFKQINDRHGHLAGDAVLVETVRRLRSVVRPYDVVGRFGGEEFIVAQVASVDGNPAVLAERMLQVIAAAPYLVDGVPLRVTASLGVSSSRETFEPLELVRLADAALYRAKSLGRNRVELSQSGSESGRLRLHA